MSIRQQLHFDVTRVFQELLDVDGAVLEGRLGLAARLLQGVVEAHVIACDAHATTTTTGGSLDQYRKTNVMSDAQGLTIGLDRTIAAGNGRHIVGLGQAAGSGFVAQEPHRFLGRADELDATFPALLGKVGILAQESVAGMDGFDIGNLCRCDNPRDVEIALGGGGRPDADGLIG